MGLSARVERFGMMPKRLSVSRMVLCALLSLILCVSFDVSFGAPAYAAKPQPFTKSPGRGEPIKVRADRLTHNRDTGVAIASGDVIIDFGPYKLIADRVVYDPRGDRLTAIGNVYFREPNGNVVRAEKLQLSDRFRRGFVDFLTIRFTNEAWITADHGERKDGNVQVFTNVIYSRCNECVDAEGTPLWRLRSAKVTHVEDEGTIYHEDSTLEFFGMPVFYMPWLSHPDPTVKKKSGFLIPTVHASSTYGVGLEVPYFWNLAPHYDLTLKPVITSRQGVLAQTKWRHRLNNGSYFVDLAGIYQLDTDLNPPGDRRWRGGVRTAGHFDITRNWQWGWNITATSDDTFLRKYDVDKRTDLISQVYIDGIDDRNYFTAKAYHFQGLLTSDNNSNFPVAAPFIEHSYTFGDAVFGGELGLDTHIFNLQREAGSDSARISTDLHWQRRMVNGYGHVFTPFAGVRGDVYVVDNVRDPAAPGGVRDSETIGRVLPRAGFDIRWPFVTQTDGIQHIFEPVGQFIAATSETDTNRLPNDDSVQFEYDPTNLFLHNKFTGIDRYEGGTRANVGFNYTLLFDTGAFVRASLGETFHIAGQNSFAVGSGLDTYRSDFIASLALQPIENFILSSMVRFDERTLEIQRHDLSITAHVNRFDVAATYTDLARAPAFGRLSAEEQFTGLASFSFSEEWELFGGARYDLRNSQQIGNIVGLRFNCDCFTAELAYTENFTSDRDVDESSAIMFKVILKTLGGVGSSIQTN